MHDLDESLIGEVIGEIVQRLLSIEHHGIILELFHWQFSCGLRQLDRIDADNRLRDDDAGVRGRDYPRSKRAQNEDSGGSKQINLAHRTLPVERVSPMRGQHAEDWLRPM